MTFRTNVFATDDDAEQDDITYRVIAITLAARLLEHGAESITIQRAEYNAMCERLAARNRGLFTDQNDERIIVSFKDNDEAEAEIKERRKNSMLDRADRTVDMLLNMIVEKGETPPPELLPQLAAFIETNQLSANQRVRLTAAKLAMALDIVSPGWRSQGASGSAVEGSTADA